jgi:hypothetical protein
MYALATDNDYKGGSLVPIIEFDPNIAVLRTVIDYNPQSMVGSYDATRMQRIESHKVKAAGMPQAAAIYFLT